MSHHPASIELIREKLKSPNPEARIVALVHAREHADAARDLAADVARLLADDTEAVAWHVPQTLRCIGHGAKDAVAVLRELRAREGASDMLVTRATMCLGDLGPCAKAALAELVRDVADRTCFEALLSIAPDDPRLCQPWVDALFSSRDARNGDARRALERARSTRVIEASIRRVAAAVETAAGSEEREQAAHALATLVRVAPDEATPLLLRLLEDETETVRRNALWAVTNAAPSAELAARAIEIVEHAAEHNEAVLGPALRALIHSGKAAEGARGLLIAVIRTRVAAVPRNGPAGGEARNLALAARALIATRQKILRREEGVEPLLDWLKRAPWEGSISWYPVRDVCTALATLVPEQREVGEAILKVAGHASEKLREDRFGAQDLGHALRRALSRLSGAEAWLERLANSGIPIPTDEDEDPSEFDDEFDDDEQLSEEEPGFDLPNFPPDDEPPALPTSEELTHGEASEVRHAVARGLECVGVETETASGDIAKAVLDWVEAVREERRQPAPDELFDVGATYGEALRAALELEVVGA